MEQPTERECVRAAREGDRSAFAALVDLYWERIRRWVFGLTQQAELAEDLTQEAFVKAWIGLRDFHGDDHFRRWLFRIAKNLALDSRKGPRGLSPHPLSESLTSRDPNPLAALVERETEQFFQAACARLPVPYRAAYLLWTQESLPYSEIAKLLEIAETTARWRVCKARQFLLKELEPYLKAPTS